MDWTQNGVTVSTATNFQVTGNRMLVGHFAFGNMVKVIPLPANAGAVAGGGVHPTGDPVFLEAVAYPGYAFVDWTEGAASVSIDPFFMFTSDVNHELVVNFVAQPSLASALGTGGVITISWPAAASDWVMQESPDLHPGSWVNSPRPVTVAGNQKQVTISTSAGAAFFRLIRP